MQQCERVRSGDFRKRRCLFDADKIMDKRAFVIAGTETSARCRDKNNLGGRERERDLKSASIISLVRAQRIISRYAEIRGE